MIILILAAIAFVLFLLLFRILRTPIAWALKLLINTLIGFVALFLLNFFGDWVGISLGVNWVNALITGVLGLPGVVLLLLIQYLL